MPAALLVAVVVWIGAQVASIGLGGSDQGVTMIFAVKRHKHRRRSSARRAMPRGPSLIASGDDERGHRVGPPPAHRRVEQEPNESTAER